MKNTKSELTDRDYRDQKHRLSLQTSAYAPVLGDANSATSNTAGGGGAGIDDVPTYEYISVCIGRTTYGETVIATAKTSNDREQSIIYRRQIDRRAVESKDVVWSSYILTFKKEFEKLDAEENGLDDEIILTYVYTVQYGY